MSHYLKAKHYSDNLSIENKFTTLCNMIKMLASRNRSILKHLVVMNISSRIRSKVFVPVPWLGEICGIIFSCVHSDVPVKAPLSKWYLHDIRDYHQILPLHIFVRNDCVITRRPGWPSWPEVKCIHNYCLKGVIKWIQSSLGYIQIKQLKPVHQGFHHLMRIR